MDNETVLKCPHCPYTEVKSRRDNYNRHIKEKHLKILSECQLCGKKMTSNSLVRHKKKPCRRLAKESNKIVHSNDSADVIDSTTYQIQAEIKVDILSNGSTKISPSEIKLNGITLVLMPTIDTGAKGRLF